MSCCHCTAHEWVLECRIPLPNGNHSPFLHSPPHKHTQTHSGSVSISICCVMESECLKCRNPPWCECLIEQYRRVNSIHRAKTKLFRFAQVSDTSRGIFWHPPTLGWLIVPSLLHVCFTDVRERHFIVQQRRDVQNSSWQAASHLNKCDRALLTSE